MCVTFENDVKYQSIGRSVRIHRHRYVWLVISSFFFDWKQTMRCVFFFDFLNNRNANVFDLSLNSFIHTFVKELRHIYASALIELHGCYWCEVTKYTPMKKKKTKTETICAEECVRLQFPHFSQALMKWIQFEIFCHHWHLTHCIATYFNCLSISLNLECFPTN